MTAIRNFVENQLSNMSARDKKLLTGMLLFFGVVVVGGMWWVLSGMLDAKADRVRVAKKHLQEIAIQEGQYKDANARISASESRLQRFSSQRLSAYLEKEASNNGVEDLRSVNEVNSEQVGTIKQTTFKVEVKKVPYEALFNFLYDIESSGYPLRITNAHLKSTRLKRDKVLDVNLEMVVYTIAEEG